MKNFIKGMLVLWTILTTISTFTAITVIRDMQRELINRRRPMYTAYRSYMNNNR